MAGSMDGSFRVCLVGAGACGLSIARAFRRHGIAYDQVERHWDVGGIWDQQNPGSPIYDSVHTNSSKTMSAFRGFPMPSDSPDYPSHRRMLAYIKAFAAAYDLGRGIRFGISVERAVKENGKWLVAFSDGSNRRYDAVVAATGFAWHPRMPTWPGSFDGEIIHSSKYRSADQLRGKRVLVIGAGNSGVDIACDAALAAARAALSMRRGYTFIPKYVFGMPADVFGKSGEWLPPWIRQRFFAALLRLLNGDVTRFGMAKPDHLPLSSHPIINSAALLHIAQGDLAPKPDVDRFEGREVVFRDEGREVFDLVIAATGYVHKVPFADPALIAAGSEESDLFLRCFSKRDPTFAAPGFLEIANGVNPYFDEFADIIANSFREMAADSSGAKAFADIVASDQYGVLGSIRYVDSPRHHVYVDTAAVRRSLQRLRRRMGWKPLVEAEMRPPASAT
jgi:Flavin-binding monooxygenase-like